MARTKDTRSGRRATPRKVAPTKVARISAPSYTPPVTRRQAAAAPYTTHLEGWQMDILRRASRTYPYGSDLDIRKHILARLARRAGTIPKIVSVHLGEFNRQAKRKAAKNQA